MSSLLVPRRLLTRLSQQTRQASHLSKIGNREVVGYGYNGMPNYADRPDFPLPAIRFKEDTPDVKALREKETGDWRKLSVEEKKSIYRASFCQTFAEFQHGTGQWKIALGCVLVASSISVWIYMALKTFVYNEIPITFDDEHQKAQLRRMLDLKVNPVDGLSSKWDYQNNKWK